MPLYESIHFTLHKEQECREQQKTRNSVFEKKHTENQKQEKGKKNQKREETEKRIRLFSRDKQNRKSILRKLPDAGAGEAI